MYYVYLLRCEGDVLYAGITTDPERRYRQHCGLLPGGAKFTRQNRPIALVALWTAPDRSAASKLEYRLKRLTHAQKESLVRGETVPGLLPEGVERTALPEMS